MTYKIIIQAPAKQDAQEYAAFILGQSDNPEVARRWLQELDQAIRSLTEMPNSYKLIDEQDAFDIPLRQVLHYSHRIVYHVNDATQTVHILRIYHGARRPLVPGQLDRP